MPRNGSGTMTPDVDFTTEAASPPIEIAKLDEVLDDIADELTNSIAADGQTNPSADLKMNGFKHTNVGAASALTHYGRVQEIIDQDYVYYVDSGSADTYAITPSPAISAYEEGQRFVFRAASNNTGASTLSVNALGAFAIQTADGSALAAGAILAGGYYEVVYDANTSPDRWVLMSMPSAITDGMLSANVPLLDASNTFGGANTFSDTTTINGVDESFAVLVTGGSTTGQSFGLIVNAGTNTSDQAFRVRNAALNDLFVVRGDGAVLKGGEGGFLFHDNTSNTSGKITVSDEEAGSAAAVGNPGDIRLVYI